MVLPYIHQRHPDQYRGFYDGTKYGNFADYDIIVPVEYGHLTTQNRVPTQVHDHFIKFVILWQVFFLERQRYQWPHGTHRPKYKYNNQYDNRRL